MPVRRIHQIFFQFDDRRLEDYPVFAASNRAFMDVAGWEYRLWDEEQVELLCQSVYPKLWNTYRSLKFAIQKVDLAKYMIADSCHGVVCDLDVIPLSHLDHIVSDRPYLFDRCSRKHIICNDFFYVGEAGLPGIFAYFAENLARINAIHAYKQRKMRYVFHTTGPDFFTRYLKRAGLSEHVAAISNRSFLDPRQRHRNVNATKPKLDIVHHLSWAPQLTQR